MVTTPRGCRGTPPAQFPARRRRGRLQGLPAGGVPAAPSPRFLLLHLLLGQLASGWTGASRGLLESAAPGSLSQTSGGWGNCVSGQGEQGLKIPLIQSSPHEIPGLQGEETPLTFCGRVPGVQPWARVPLQKQDLGPAWPTAAVRVSGGRHHVPLLPIFILLRPGTFHIPQSLAGNA